MQNLKFGFGSGEEYWREMRKPLISSLVVVATLLPLHGAQAAGPPRAHAIENVRIVVAPGRVIDSGTVVIRNGLIEAAGTAVATPADARVWDGEGLTVYPGLIESYSRRSWPQPEADPDSADATPQPPADGHDNVLVQPQRDLTPFAADEARARKLRAAGFTTALAVPGDGLLRGEAVLLNLGEGDLRHNLLRRHVAQAAAFATHPGGDYPNSLMGSVALFRQTMLDAAWYSEAQAAFSANPRQERPAFNSALAALAPVVAGGHPLLFETDDVTDTLRAARLLGEFKLNAILIGNGEEYRRLEAVKATGLPHILPISFPAAPMVKADDDLSVDLSTLRHWDRAPDNPAQLLATGLTVAFSTHGLSDPAKIYGHLAKSIERGLSADAALAALTTAPAKMLGIADRAGTVEAGKMANLVVVEGDLLVDKPKIRAVWIDGRRLEIKETKPPEVTPNGTWEVTILGGGQEFVVSMEIEGEIDDLSGKLLAQGATLPISSAEVSGKILTVVFDSTPVGMPGEINMSFNIDGDSASGSGMSPQGPFTLKAVRTAGGPGLRRLAAQGVNR